MNKFVIAAIAAATVLPSAAMAQSHDPSFGRHDTKVVVVDRNDHHGPARHRPVVQHLIIGSRLEPGFIARQVVIKHPKQYRLVKAGAGNRWIKVRDDAVLVNLRTGRVVNIVHRAF